MVSHSLVSLGQSTADCLCCDVPGGGRGWVHRRTRPQECLARCCEGWVRGLVDEHEVLKDNARVKEKPRSVKGGVEGTEGRVLSADGSWRSGGGRLP